MKRGIGLGGNTRKIQKEVRIMSNINLNLTKYAPTNERSIKVGKELFGFVVAAGLVIGATTPVFAGSFAQIHPRRAQITGRFAQMNTRLTGSYGHLGGQYQNLERQSNQYENQMHQDVKANGGYLTKAQQSQFNQDYSKLGQQVSADQAKGAPSGQWMQNHPRQAQVRTGSEQLNSQLSNDYGNLGGHYTGLERANGGYLTTQQQQQLDTRESNLQNSINKDLGQ
jgi:hypothetical protein